MDVTNNELPASDEYSPVVLKVEVDEDYNDLGITRTIKVEDDEEGDLKSDITMLELEHIAIKEQKHENEEQSLDEGSKRKFKTEYLPENVKLEDEKSEEECPRKKTKNINVELDLKEESLDEDEDGDNEDYENNEGGDDDDDESSDKYGHSCPSLAFEESSERTKRRKVKEIMEKSTTTQLVRATESQLLTEAVDTTPKFEKHDSNKYIQCGETLSERQYKQKQAATDVHADCQQCGAVDLKRLREGKPFVSGRRSCSTNNESLHGWSQRNHATGRENKLETCAQAKQGKFKCKDCDFSTNYKSSLERHIKVKYNGKKFKCQGCDFSSGYERSLQRHIQGKHSEKKFQCEDCDFSTGYEVYLETHVQRTHSEKKFNCSDCDFSTRYASNLEVHVQAKHRQELIKCKDCDFFSGYKCNLRRHIEVKHGERKFMCKDCDFSTGYKRNLKRHIQAKHSISKDYKCKNCDFSTGYQRGLETHILAKHSEEILKYL